MKYPWTAFDQFLADAADKIRAERPDTILCDDGFEVMITYVIGDDGEQYAEITSGELPFEWEAGVKLYPSNRDDDVQMGQALVIRLPLEPR